MILLHGTTRYRAEQIVLKGPNPRYPEPGGDRHDDGFSMFHESGPFHFGTPHEYALGKAKAFPAEGGPVILAVDVPEEIVTKTEEVGLPRSQGLVQFDCERGLEDLLAAWPVLKKEIRSLS